MASILIMIQLGVYFDHSRLLGTVTTDDFITVYALTILGIGAVVAALALFIYILISVYWKRIARGVGRIGKKFSSHKVDKTLELDIVF